MKKTLLSAALFLLVMAAFSQEKRNGDIYMEHPYITVVYNSVKAYLDKDIATNTKIFSDTAHFWASGMTKRIPITEALKMWADDFNFYDSIAVVKQGYPDYLAYKDQDAKTVQSWWIWKGKSKKQANGSASHASSSTILIRMVKLLLKPSMVIFQKWSTNPMFISKIKPLLIRGFFLFAGK